MNRYTEVIENLTEKLNQKRDERDRLIEDQKDANYVLNKTNEELTACEKEIKTLEKILYILENDVKNEHFGYFLIEAGLIDVMILCLINLCIEANINNIMDLVYLTMPTILPMVLLNGAQYNSLCHPKFYKKVKAENNLEETKEKLFKLTEREERLNSGKEFIQKEVAKREELIATLDEEIKLIMETIVNIKEKETAAINAVLEEPVNKAKVNATYLLDYDISKTLARVPKK